VIPTASFMSARARWRRGLLVLGAVALLVLGSFWIGPRADGLALDVQPVPLNPSNPGQTEAGPLRFRGGLWLRSADPRFGGLSDLRVTPDGSQLLAVSDCGRGFVATLVHDSRGHLIDLRSPQLVDLVGSDGGALLSRSERDAEALAFDGEDGLLVGFEVRPRIWRYARSPPFAGPSEPWPAPPVEEACRGNRSLETLVDLGGGRLFLACEAASARQDSVVAWVGAGETWATRSYPLAGEGPGGAFTPTAAARLPGGDVLVLERRFPPLEVRLMRLSKGSLDDTGPFEPREIARLAPPESVDNFEGLDVRQDSSGTTLLYLLSDDNGCSKQGGVVPPRLQRTLLLLFELTG
jgi:hypothetical protein